MPAPPAIGDDGAMTNWDREVERLVEHGRDREAAALAVRHLSVATRQGGSMDPLEQLDQLAPVLGGVVTEIGADQLDDPTPCAEFTVRGVLEHMIARSHRVRGRVPWRGRAAVADETARRPIDRFGQAMTGLVEAVRSPGALDRTIRRRSAMCRGRAFARFVVLDGLVHGWDLATATGQPYQPPAALVADGRRVRPRGDRAGDARGRHVRRAASKRRPTPHPSNGSSPSPGGSVERSSQMTTTPPTDRLTTTIKTRQRDTWASGDYAVIGTTLQIVGEIAVRGRRRRGRRARARRRRRQRQRVARRGPPRLRSDRLRLRRRAARRHAGPGRSEGLTIETRQADAEALPFADASFDVVLSTFGVMFSPNQERAAAELLRVCRPGGRIGLANWTPAGFIGQMFKIVGRHVPPPAGIASPLAWGTEARLAELFGAERRVARRAATPVRVPLPLGAGLARHVPHLLRADAQGVRRPRRRGTQGVSRHELLALANEHNTSTTGTLRIPSEYLEVVAVKAP